MSGEQAFIDILKTIATDAAARGLEDDAAVLRLDGKALVLTHDVLVEGVHFLPDTPAQDIAWKLVATNMSDLAAKGAKPLGALLSYMLRDDDWDTAFAAGLKEALSRYHASLLGGDTVRAKGDAARSFGLTALGEAPACGVPSRSGAKPGDDLYICGTIGDAMLGFEALRDGEETDAALTRAYLRPKALLTEGQTLAPHVSAMMDVSDGLLLDAKRMADASNLTFAIDRDAIPFSAEARACLGTLDDESMQQKRDTMLRWGDDYALLFTAPADSSLPVVAKAIGKAISRGDSALILDGQAVSDHQPLGYQH